MPKFNVLLLVLLNLYTRVTVNRLNLKYIHRSVSAEWLMHPTKDAGGTQFEFLRIPVINFRPLDVNVCLGVFLGTVEGLRTREQHEIHSFTVNNQIISYAYMQVFRIITNLDGFYK